jgi:DNA-binding MarR family transcriptional regulator
MRNAPQDPARALARRFDRAMVRMGRRLFPEIAKQIDGGLTPVQMLVFRILRIRGPMRVTDLARHLDVGASAMTLMLNKLEARALIARRQDGRDRRVVWVCVTRAGTAAAARMERFRAQALGRYLGRLPRSDVRRMVQVVERLADLMHGRAEP